MQLKLYGVELGLDTADPGCGDLSKVTVVLRSVLAQDAKIRQANGGQYGFRDFFPSVIVRMSSAGDARGAAITPGDNWGSHRSITIWNNGYSYWPIDANNSGCIQGQPTANCTNIFSPQLITHEFGHALSNEVMLTGASLAAVFRNQIPGIEEHYVVIDRQEVSLWEPFVSGSQNTTLPRNRGRFYGNRLEEEKTSKTGELGAEAYTVWVYGAYNEAVRGLPGVTIDAQEQFWNDYFSSPSDLR